MIKLTKIEIQGMHNVDHKTYNLGDITYLYGHNGAGKSTVMQAIQLALLGYIPGTAKTKSEIFKHANGNMMSVTLYMNDGIQDITINRSWSGVGSTINTATLVNPIGYSIESIISDLELPIFNFSEFVNMTANKLKDWFIEFLPSMDMHTDWESVLREKLVSSGITDIDENLISDSADDIAAYGLSGMDEVRKANEYFKSMVSMTKKDLDRLQHTIQSLIFYDDISDADTIESVQAEKNKWNTIKESIQNRDRIIRRNESIQKQIAEIDPYYSKYSTYEGIPKYKELSDYSYQLKLSIDSAELALSEWTKKQQQFDMEQADITKAINSLEDKKSSMQEILDKGNICPFTSQVCNSISNMFDDYRAQIDHIDSEIKNLSVSKECLLEEINKCSEKLKDLRDGISENTKKLRETEDQMNAIIHDFDKISMLTEQLEIVPDVDHDLGEVASKLTELDSKAAKITANKQYNDMIDIITVDKYKAESNLECFKKWVELTGVNGLQSDVGAYNPFTQLETSVDTYIKAVFGKSVTSKFNITTKANSFNFGIMRNNSYVPFNLLSSGEKCLFTVALMLSIVKISKSELKLIMIDDLLDHLDNVNIVKLFDSLSELHDIQIIFAGVKSVVSKYVVEVK